MTTSISTSTIVAQAFRYMEASPIASFDDASEQAQAAAEQYPNALRLCLEAADWSFASVLVHLPEALLTLGVIADPDLPYAYAPPGDAVRLHEVGDFNTAWRLDRDFLRADDPAPLRLRYTSLDLNEAQMPATFRDAVALRLACLLGARWLTTQSKMQDLESRAQLQLKTAMRQDARTASQQRYDDLAQPDDWVSEATR